MGNQHFLWENQLFLWPFSIANCWFTGVWGEFPAARHVNTGGYLFFSLIRPVGFLTGQSGNHIPLATLSRLILPFLYNHFTELDHHLSYMDLYIYMVIPPYQLVIYPITFPFVGEFGYTFIQGCCQHLRPPCGYHLSVMDGSKPAIFQPNRDTPQNS